jgi:hypothetical protein
MEQEKQMSPVTQALIPPFGGNILSSQMHSFAEAFNSRILNGAGDSHWRIPYYIFSAYFRKPRIDDGSFYTPESEFFDFYQFVSPESNDTWPPADPQTPEGANLQSNFLNRFIFGMTFSKKDPQDGAWIYEREDVRVQKSQEFFLNNDAVSFRGKTFFGFTSLGTDNGTGAEYTAFGLANEIHHPGYISGNSINPSGKSYGGFYGSNALIINKNGCGTEGFKDYPLSLSSLVPIHQYIKPGAVKQYKVCDGGTSSTFKGNYSKISSSNHNNFFVFNYRRNELDSVEILAKNKWHLTQNQSSIFLGREQKNHIYRLLYNFITYAKGFDFDWFFSNQYSFAPEIGSFIGINSTYSDAAPQLYNRANLLNTEIKINQARLELRNIKLSKRRYSFGTFSQAGSLVTITFTGSEVEGSHSYQVNDWIDVYLTYSGAKVSFPNNNYNRFKIVQVIQNTIQINISGASSAVSGNYIGGAQIRTFLYVTNGIESKTIDNGAYINILTPNKPNSNDPYQQISGEEDVKTYLKRNDYLQDDANLSTYLYQRRSVVNGSLMSNQLAQNEDPNDYGQLVTVPLGFTLQIFEVLSTNIKKCTILIHFTKIRFAPINLKFEEYDKKEVVFSQTGEKLSLAISPNLFLKTDENYICLVRFEIKDIVYFNDDINGGLLVSPIFLFSYMPKIEDAYSLLRACAYYGLKDADFNNVSHPFKILNKDSPGAVYFSDKLKSFGTLGKGDIRGYEHESHGSKNTDLNTNAVFEASRRLSLFTRILSPNNIKAVVGDRTLKFDRFARQSGYLPKFKVSEVLASETKFFVLNKDISVLQNDPTNVYMDWWNVNLPLFKNLFLDFYSSSMLPLPTDDVDMIHPYYSGFDIYAYSGKNEGKLYKVDAEIIERIRAQGLSSSPINASTVKFNPGAFLVNYDCLVKDLDADDDITKPFYWYRAGNSKYIYFQFEDKYGEKYFRFNGENKIYQVRRFDNFTIGANSEAAGKFYQTLDLDAEGYAEITGDLGGDRDPGKINPGIAIFSFTRLPKVIGSDFYDALSVRRFYFIDKKDAVITTEGSGGWRYNYKVFLAIFDNKLTEFANTNEYKKSDFSSYKLRLNEPIFTEELLEELSGADQILFTLELNGGSDHTLSKLNNNLYENYHNNDLILSKEALIYKKGNSNPYIPFDLNSKDDYNKYLAGYKILVSHFLNYDEVAKQKHLFSVDYDNRRETFRMSVLLSDGVNEKVLFSGPIGSEVKLPNWDDTWHSSVEFKFYFNVNVRRKTSIQGLAPTEVVNVPIYLSIINSIPSEVNPGVVPLIRSGSVQVKRTGSLLDPSKGSPEKRDIFQGIAPDLETVPSGFLLQNREYAVSGSGSIVHKGVTYQATLGGTKFFAASSDYAMNGTPIVTPTNGIMEVAFSSSFTNEWCFWMNFLPFSPFNSSIFKREVYGDTNSPFIDRCHVNSEMLPKSAENNHINLGQQRAYAPTAPPSYRYLPLILPNYKGYVSQNLAVSSLSDGSNVQQNGRQLQEKFYTSCEAFKKPYKIKKAYIDLSDTQHVYIELDRKIDGYDAYSTDSAVSGETARSDYNGLKDWLSLTYPARFRIGDASITNENGLFQATSVTSNQYLGSYYPRFFFVKLIPKPFFDNNIIQNDSDSPCFHEMIKQGELYLEAMREGFTANPSDNLIGKNSKCEDLNGHLTIPDLKYDQLFMNATTILGVGTSLVGTFGNKYPSLLPSSINFNLRVKGIIQGYQFGTSSVKRLDNPVGFGSVPNVGMYRESYAYISKAINYLLYFRVPVPLDYESTLSIYQRDEYAPDDFVLSPGDAQAMFSPTPGPTSLASLKGFQNSAPNVYPISIAFTIGPTSLRRTDGALEGIGAGQGYVIGATNQNQEGTYIGDIRLKKFYSECDLKIVGVDVKLKETAYAGVSHLIPTNMSSYASVYSSQEVKRGEQAKVGDKYWFFNEAVENGKIINTFYEIDQPNCIPGVNTKLIPPPLLSGPLFYNYKNDLGRPNQPNLFGFKEASFCRSSIGMTLFDTGFQIIKLQTESPQVIIN